MRVKTVQQGLAVPATATTTNGTALNLSTEPVLNPFQPGASAVGLVNLRAAANATINVQTSDDGTTYTTEATITVTTAETRQVPVDVDQLRAYVRIQIVTAGTSGAGSVDLFLVNQ